MISKLLQDISTWKLKGYQDEDTKTIYIENPEYNSNKNQGNRDVLAAINITARNKRKKNSNVKKTSTDCVKKEIKKERDI